MPPKAFFARVPVGGTFSVDVYGWPPLHRRLVLTHAVLTVPLGTRLAAAPGNPPPVDWVTLTSTTVEYTSEWPSEAHTLANLAWPGGGPAAVAGMTASLHVVLDGNATLAAEWVRLSPHGSSSGSGVTGIAGDDGALAGVSVHVFGYYEDVPESY